MLIRIKFKQVILFLFRKRRYVSQNDCFLSYGRLNIVFPIDNIFVEDYISCFDDFPPLGDLDHVDFRGHIPGHIPDDSLPVAGTLFSFLSLRRHRIRAAAVPLEVEYGRA